MNTDTGLFERIEDAPKGSNAYAVGDSVTLDGDTYIVERLFNHEGRGRLVLRATSESDRFEMAPRNRHERRVKARETRLSDKRANKRIDEVERKIRASRASGSDSPADKGEE